MRPSKFTQALADEICEAIAEGCPRKAAAESVGICERTLMLWLQHGRRARSGKFFQFLQAVKKAEAQAVKRKVRVINRAGEENWTAAAWWLERRCPDDFSRKDRMEVSGKGKGGSIVVKIIGGKASMGDL